MKKPVMLFMSETCSSCKLFKPILEEVVDSYSSILELQIIDADRYPSLVSEFNIRSVPTLVVGGISHPGQMDREDLMRWLRDVGAL